MCVAGTLTERLESVGVLDDEFVDPDNLEDADNENDEWEEDDDNLGELGND